MEHAEAVDAEEDARFGDERGDELPEQLSTAEGRQRWLRVARRRLDERRARDARPIPGQRPKRLKEAKRRVEDHHQVQLDANAAYEDYRRHGRMKNGRRLGAHSPPKPLPAAAATGGQDQPQRSGRRPSAPPHRLQQIDVEQRPAGALTIRRSPS